MVYGDLLDSLYGRLDPTPAERMHVLEDGEDDRREPDPYAHDRRLARPRQAPPRAARLESGILFAGDAVGVRLPDAGVLRPATPPPDFDLDQAISSLHKFADRNPAERRARPLRPRARTRSTPCDEAEGILRQWAEVAEAAWREGRDIAEALDAAFAGELAGIDPAHREKLETLNGMHSNAAGFRRWLEQRQGHEHGHSHWASARLRASSS